MGLFDGKTAAKPLRLMAESADDLPAIAALVQDAALRSGDLDYDAKGRHLTLRMNRFCHEAPGRTPLRAPSVLRLSCVTRIQVRGLDPAVKDTPLSVLDIAVEETDPPSCVFTLRFAGPVARDVRVEAECIDVLLMDLAAPRRAKLAPKH